MVVAVASVGVVGGQKRLVGVEAREGKDAVQHDQREHYIEFEQDVPPSNGQDGPLQAVAAALTRPAAPPWRSEDRPET